MHQSSLRIDYTAEMKAITYSRYGSPAVLQVRDVPTPEPKDDELLIRVKAAEATKGDCEMRSFRFPVKWFWLPMRFVFGLRAPRRQILGGYFSGQVVSVGKNVTRFAVGDAVFGAAQLRLGAYGEYLALPEGYTLVPKPSSMSYTEAAAVPLGGLNALHFLNRANVQPGETVLIQGAGGSIGAHAVQIAKAMGATVTVVDSGIKRDFLLGIGADHFIDYAEQDCFSSGQSYDVIFSMVAGSSYSAAIRALNPGGRYLTANPRLSVMLRSVLTNRFSDKTATFAFAGETLDELSTLKQMIEAGQIRPIVDRVYRMNEAAEAHKRVETEQRLGAVVIAIGGDR